MDSVATFKLYSSRCKYGRSESTIQVAGSGADGPASVLIPGRRSLPHCYIVRPAVAINQIIRVRKLSQTGAARRPNVNQPKVSALSWYTPTGILPVHLADQIARNERSFGLAAPETGQADPQ